MNREQNAAELRRLRTSEALVGRAAFAEPQRSSDQVTYPFGEHMAKEQHSGNAELTLG